jgi:hypothetical protein
VIKPTPLTLRSSGQSSNPRNHDQTWEGLHNFPRLGPSVGIRRCTYRRWFARALTHQQGLLPVSIQKMRIFLRFRMACMTCPYLRGAGMVSPDISVGVISVAFTPLNLRLKADLLGGVPECALQNGAGVPRRLPLANRQSWVPDSRGQCSSTRAGAARVGASTRGCRKKPKGGRGQPASFAWILGSLCRCHPHYFTAGVRQTRMKQRSAVNHG